MGNTLEPACVRLTGIFQDGRLIRSLQAKFEVTAEAYVVDLPPHMLQP